MTVLNVRIVHAAEMYNPSPQSALHIDSTERLYSSLSTTTDWQCAPRSWMKLLLFGRIEGDVVFDN